MGVVRNGCEQCVHWTLKLAVSQEWIDGTKLIFCKVVQIQESKKYPNDFLGGSGQKWERSFSSWGPKICWISYGLNWFFACWLWCNNFLLEQRRTSYFWLLNVNLLQLYLFHVSNRTIYVKRFYTSILGFFALLVTVFPLKTLYVMLCGIWYHLYNLKYMKNTHGVVLLLITG